MKKKYSATSQDKKDWIDFTKNLKNISVKKENFSNKKNKNTNLIKKIDLHGVSLNDANFIVENLINNCFEQGYKKLIIITGKGTRSKISENPYISQKMGFLRYSVPDYIKRNEDLLKKIVKITQADQVDGGEGAFYIFLKKKKL